MSTNKRKQRRASNKARKRHDKKARNKRATAAKERQQQMTLAEKRAKALKEMEAFRKCDECTACCDIMGVHELRKPYFAKCEHVCAGGCAIYANRPKSCVDWLCGWRCFPDMLEEWRPDKSGIMIAVDMESETIYLDVYEVWPNALKGIPPAMKHWIDMQKAKMVLRLHQYGNRPGVRFKIDDQYPQGSSRQKVEYIYDPNEPRVLLLKTQSGEAA